VLALVAFDVASVVRPSVIRAVSVASTAVPSRTTVTIISMRVSPR